MRIRSKIFISSFLPLLLILLFAATLFYKTAEKTLERQIFKQFQSIASLQQARLQGIISQNRERLGLVTSRTQLRISLDAFQRDHDPAHLERVRRILEDALASISGFRRMTIFGIDGRLLLSTNDDELPAVLKSQGDFLQRSMREKHVETLVLDHDKNLRLLLGGPLHLNDLLLGAMVIECGTEDVVASVNDFSGLGESGEIIVVRPQQDGGFLFLFPTRFDPKAALLRVMSHGEGCPVAETGRMAEGILHFSRDYRGKSVMILTRKIESTNWIMVVKIDEEEAHAPINRSRTVIMATTLVLLLLGALFSLVLARSITAPISVLAGLTDLVAEGDYSRVADENSSDEIGLLARSFNKMAKSLDTTHKRLEKKIVELEREISERSRIEAEMETLREILPLCSYCKKVRDEEGSWHQVDAYLQRHAKADVSHSICPSCLKKHYPEQYAALRAEE